MGIRLNKLKSIFFKHKEEKKRYIAKSNMAIKIGKMVATERKKRNMSQLELAQKLKTQQPTISRIETGITLPTLNYLIRIAKVLDTELIAPKFK